MGIPSVKCFDKNTLIQMNDGLYKKIQYIELGDILYNNNIVTAKVKVATKGSTMYILNNIIVSDSHIVKYNDNWIPVSNHPKAIKIDSYNEEYLYCLNTTNKVIEINDLLFTDWDEIYDEKVNIIINNTENPIPNKNKQFIHTYLDCGFIGSTKIATKNTSSIDIEKIKINDILENGEKVYCIVEIDGSTVVEQFKYNLGENKFVEGYIPMLNVEKQSIENKYKKLYHLLTDNGKIKIENTVIQDYNAAIDRFLENN
jgi:DNA-binding cell septation regulator SpoVG